MKKSRSSSSRSAGEDWQKDYIPSRGRSHWRSALAAELLIHAQRKGGLRLCLRDLVYRGDLEHVVARPACRLQPHANQPRNVRSRVERLAALRHGLLLLKHDTPSAVAERDSVAQPIAVVFDHTIARQVEAAPCRVTCAELRLFQGLVGILRREVPKTRNLKLARGVRQ